MSLESIVNVTISRETASVSRAGFGVALVLGINKGVLALSEEFTTLSSVLLKFNSASLEYAAAQALFAQSPGPTKIRIGRRDTSDTTVITVDTAVDNTDYTCEINGTEFKINSGGSATIASIALALVTAINLGSEPVTALDNVDGTYDLDADVASAPYTVLTDVRQSSAFATGQTPAEDMADIQQESDDWYGLLYTDRTEADVLAIAAWTEAVKKVFGTSTDDADTVDTTDAADTTTLVAQLKAAGYARTFAFYHVNAATAFPEAALFGTILPLDPGSYTAAYKLLSGITVDTLTETQQTNALAKNCNIYLTVGGRNLTKNGTVSEGEWLDNIIGIDWTQTRMIERIFGVLVTVPKVPFTDEGITGIEGEVVAQLQDGQAVGFLAIDPPYVTNVPKASEISAQSKALRTFDGMTWSATLANAIHIVDINGTVSY